MKAIKAFIRPSKLKQVVEALKKEGFEHLTLFKGEGTGARERVGTNLELEFAFTNSLVVKLELICQNNEASIAVQLIFEHARSSEQGSSIVCVSDIKHAFSIKTRESIKRFDL